MEDPSVILALGRSGWGDDIARREDPAGMGVFSLAGRDVEVRSCPRSTGDGWSIRIASGDWESGAPIAVAPCTHPFGTEIRVPIDEQWPKSLRSEEHTSELQSLMRISYAVFCLQKKKTTTDQPQI